MDGGVGIRDHGLEAGARLVLNPVHLKPSNPNPKPGTVFVPDAAVGSACDAVPAAQRKLEDWRGDALYGVAGSG